MADRSSFTHSVRSFVGRHALTLAVLWTIGILVALSIPTPDVPDSPVTLDLDKGVHALLFAGLGVLWMRALQPSAGDDARHAWTRGAGLFLVGTLFATLTEMYQAFLPIPRRGDPYDALADVIGLGAAIVTYALIRTLQNVRSSPP